MKKIINGKMYDTETAKAIKNATSGEPRSFDWCQETLYRKRTGEYFLAGKGGARTRYAERVDRSTWSGGEGIVPLTYGEAKEWAEMAMTAEEYETEFGQVTEGELVHLHISLPADIADRIRKAAAQEGISVSECVGRRF